MTTDYIALRKAVTDSFKSEIQMLREENALLRARLMRVLPCEPAQPLGEYPELPESAAPRPLPVLGGLHPGAGEPAQDPGAGVRSTVQQ